MPFQDRTPLSPPDVDKSFYEASLRRDNTDSIERYLQMLRWNEDMADTIDPVEQPARQPAPQLNNN